jgi:PAS domain S-box-containing protein
MSRLLIVEEHSGTPRAIAPILAAAGFEVTCAAQVEQAWQQLVHDAFDLVIADLDLSDGSGIELCRRIKRDTDRRAVPVLLITAQSDPVRVLRCLEAGVDGLVTRALEPEQIVGRVRRTLQIGAWPPAEGKAYPTQVHFLGQEFQLRVWREQLLDVLLSAFEEVVELSQRHSTELGQRQQAELALQRNEQRYRSLVIATSQITWTTDASGQVVEDIPTWRAFTGQTCDEILGSGWLDAVHPKDRGETARLWDEAVASRSVFETECRIRKYDGGYRHFSLRGVPVVEGEDLPAHYWQSPDFSVRGVPVVEDPRHVREWIGTCADITEQKLAKQELVERARALARSNQELEQFAYVASHDLQEPVRMVANFTQLLARRFRNQLGHDADDFIRYIVDGATRMQALIHDLLVYSRVLTRGKPLTATNSNIAVQAAIANLRLATEEAGATVTCGPLPVVYADETQLIQLFQNLIANAIRFHRTEPPRVDITATCSAAEWIFSVRDNGIGIDAAQFDRIFLIFQRLHTRDEYPGTGVGLAICRKIVERHGGRIWVESQPGAGSVFHFSLPISRTALAKKTGNPGPEGAVDRD